MKMTAYHTTCRQDIRIQQKDFDFKNEMEKITALNKNIGAVVTFTGFCRDNENSLAALEIEHYSGMAESEITRIASTACQRWPLYALTVIHRYGYIKAGEQIVLVITASAHRRAAFEAADFLMDFLKTDIPFWKKEYPADSHTANWVQAHEQDNKNRNRW